MAVVLDGHRHAHLTGRNHVNGGLVAFEDLEYLAQEAGRTEHTARLYLDGRDVVFGGDRLDFALHEGVVDDGPFSVRIHRVLQPDRDAGVFCWLHAGGVENLCPEVSQLRSFLKVQLAHGFGLLYHARVIVVHSVDVCPDLDFFGIDGSPDKRCRVVRSAPLQIVHFAVGIAADEALCDIDLIALILFHDGGQVIFDVLTVGLGVLVRAHEVECR